MRYGEYRPAPDWPRTGRPGPRALAAGDARARARERDGPPTHGTQVGSFIHLLQPRSLAGLIWQICQTILSGTEPSTALGGAAMGRQVSAYHGLARLARLSVPMECPACGLKQRCAALDGDGTWHIHCPDMDCASSSCGRTVEQAADAWTRMCSRSQAPPVDTGDQEVE